MHPESNPLLDIVAFIACVVVSILLIPVVLTVARAILAYVFQDFTV